MKTKIIFTKRTILFILKALNYKLDKQGFVINKDETFIWDAAGLKFKPKDIIGIINKTFITRELQLLNTKL